MNKVYECTIKFVAAKQIEFISKYHLYPNFVKMPEWVVSVLKENSVIQSCCATRFRGLIVCPTPSIETISEIEVF